MDQRAWIVCTLLALGAAGALLFGAGNSAPPQDLVQVSAKRAHLAFVLEELSGRDVSHLTRAQQDARAASLQRLQDYSDRGIFPVNTEYPGREVPYFIDKYDTRCAVAYLMDRAGDGDLLLKLAGRDNHAYLAELPGHPEIVAWLESQGMTVEEACFIQAPGLIDDRPGRVDTPGDEDEPIPTTPPAGPSEPPAEVPQTPSTPDTARRGGRTASNSVTWEQWWTLNRDAFLNLRQRYHEGVTLTGEAKRQRPRRPTEAELATTLRPFLRKMARDRDRDIRATALMAWARAAGSDDASAVIKETLAYLGDSDNRYRDYMILALGIVKHADGVAPLLEILRNTSAGRRILARPTRIPDSMRAFAAVALGESGSAEAVDTLILVLRKERGKAKELRQACVTGLGALGTERARDFLMAGLKRERWSDEVLAAIPPALARMGDASSLPALSSYLARFKKPTEVRQSCALAVGRLAPATDYKTLRMLEATARRDPDSTTRQFAILSIGELALRHPVGEDEKTRKRLVRFFSDGLAGRFKQSRDLPWLCLSAALFARGSAEHSEPVRRHLVATASKARRVDLRAAAVVGLGILGSKEDRAVLRKLYDASKDQKLRGYLAEALGIVGDRSMSPVLLKLCRTDPSGTIRYQAATGLGFLADATTIVPMVEALGLDSSRSARTALTRAIGEIGDKRAIEGLVRIAGDDTADEWQRQGALGALGVLGQSSDRSWASHLKRGFNFAVATPTLRRLLMLF